MRAITKALGIEMRDVGIAGMKDKVAVTTQWVSVPAPPKSPDLEERAKALVIDDIKVLDAKRHTNKLKTGHLKGNRFDIVVRDVAADAVAGRPRRDGAHRQGRRAERVRHAALRHRGRQRAERAREWLTGKERAPGDPRLRRFHFSALQSAAFNALLDARVADGTWNQPMLGDLLKKEDTGGMFLCTDVQADRERADRGEVCPTGPIVGARMRWPEGEVKELEERTRRPVPGGRRPRARAISRRRHPSGAAAPRDRVLSRTSDE